MNSSAVNGVTTVTVDTILLFIWMTCRVHFKSCAPPPSPSFLKTRREPPTSPPPLAVVCYPISILSSYSSVCIPTLLFYSEIRVPSCGAASVESRFVRLDIAGCVGVVYKRIELIERACSPSLLRWGRKVDGCAANLTVIFARGVERAIVGRVITLNQAARNKMEFADAMVPLT